MGYYYSEDSRFATSTLDFPPITLLTPKGMRDRDAAITIQRWWRERKQQSMLENYLSSDELFSGVRLRHKRKHEDTDSDIVEYDTDTDLDIEEINSSELGESENESEIERELQTIANNSFIWDLWFSFYNFLWKLIGY